MKEAAAFLVAHPGEKPEIVDKVSQNEGPPNNGFDDKGIFRWDGKIIKINPSFQFFRVLKILFESEQMTVHRDEFCRFVLTKHDFAMNPDVPEKTFKSPIDRFNKRCRIDKLKMKAEVCGDYIILTLS